MGRIGIDTVKTNPARKNGLQGQRYLISILLEDFPPIATPTRFPAYLTALGIYGNVKEKEVTVPTKNLRREAEEVDK
jgi:hypothetical protein